MSEDEVIELEDSKTPSAVQIRESRWEAPALAQLSEEDFTQRVAMAELQIERMATIQRSIMKEGVDYGKEKGIPKPFLKQPGAQVLNRFAGFVPKYEIAKTLGDGIDTPALDFEVRCILEDTHGETVGEGMGCANSHEKKHRYRYGDKSCPECGQETIRKGQSGYFCGRKLGGCGKNFAPDSDEGRALDAQDALIENPDPHDLANTCLKMACKRALVAATVNAHACSGQFAQDEPPPSRGEDPPANAPAPQAAAAQQKTQQQRSSGASNTAPITEPQRKLCFAKLKHRFEELGHPFSDESRRFATEQILEGFAAEEFSDLQKDQVNSVIEKIDNWS